MTNDSKTKELRENYPWIYAEEGYWVPGVVATPVSISGMTRDWLVNCASMVNRNLDYVGRTCEDADALAEFRIYATAKIAELQGAIALQPK